MNMKYIFIGFYGAGKISQSKKITIFKNGLQCWDLRKMPLEEFVFEIKKIILPVNKNIKDEYYISSDDTSLGITQIQFNRCSYGILVPVLFDEDQYMYGVHKKLISLLNLFQSKFIKNSAFFVSDMGITALTPQDEVRYLGIGLDARDGFKNNNFYKFYTVMAPMMKYFVWSRDEVVKWSDEDWRIYMACTFYYDLGRYQSSKSTYMWQRESADMATLLELLITAGNKSEEIGYRLRKRISVLVSNIFPNIEKDIADLYSDRSLFIHGSFYKNIAKGMKKNKDDDAFPPLPDFAMLHNIKEKVRLIFVIYLYLDYTIRFSKPTEFIKFNNVQDLLEVSIIDIRLRNQIFKQARPVIRLLLKPR
jgi:hypothetical protein